MGRSTPNKKGGNKGAGTRSATAAAAAKTNAEPAAASPGADEASENSSENFDNSLATLSARVRSLADAQESISKQMDQVLAALTTLGMVPAVQNSDGETPSRAAAASPNLSPAPPLAAAIAGLTTLLARAPAFTGGVSDTSAVASAHAHGVAALGAIAAAHVKRVESGFKALIDANSTKMDEWCEAAQAMVRTLANGSAYTWTPAERKDAIERLALLDAAWAPLCEAHTVDEADLVASLWRLAEAWVRGRLGSHVSLLVPDPVAGLNDKKAKLGDVVAAVQRYVRWHGSGTYATGYLVANRGEVQRMVRHLRALAHARNAACTTVGDDEAALVALANELHNFNKVRSNYALPSRPSDPAVVGAVATSPARTAGLFVYASIHGSVVRTCIDTGAAASVLSERSARQLGLKLRKASAADSAIGIGGTALHVTAVTSFVVVIGGAALYVPHALVLAESAVDVVVGVADLWGKPGFPVKIESTSAGKVVIRVGNGKQVRAYHRALQHSARICPRESVGAIAIVAAETQCDGDGAALLHGTAIDRRADDDIVDVMYVRHEQPGHSKPMLIEVQGALRHTLASIAPRHADAAVHAASVAPQPQHPPSPEWLEQCVSHVLHAQHSATPSEAARIERCIRDGAWRQFYTDGANADGTAMPRPAKDVIFSVRLLPTADIDALRSPFRRYSQREQAALDALADKLIAAGAARESTSPVRSACVVVPKKDANGQFTGWRVAIDYRRVNAATFADARGMPRIDELLAWLAHGDRFLVLDVWDAFYHIPVEAASVPLTATDFGNGRFLEFLVMPFGLKGAPACWQRFMDNALRNVSDSTRAYVDDVFTRVRRGDDLADAFERVMHVAAENGITFKASKTQITDNVHALGHIVHSGTYAPDPKRLAAFAQMTPPQSKEQLMSFNGMLSMFTRHFPARAQNTSELRRLASKHTRFEWSPAAQAEFDAFKRYVLESCVSLAPLDDAADVVLHTDYSTHGVGWIITSSEGDGDVQRIVSCGSIANVDAERNYGNAERSGTFAGELHALRTALAHDGALLRHRPVRWATDNRTLAYLHNGSAWPRGANTRLVNTLSEISEFAITAEWRPGTDNAIADYFSRWPHAPLAAGSAAVTTAATLAPVITRGKAAKKSPPPPPPKSLSASAAAKRVRTPPAARHAHKAHPSTAKRRRGRPHKPPSFPITIDLRDRIGAAAQALAGFPAAPALRATAQSKSGAWRADVCRRQCVDGTLAPWLAQADSPTRLEAKQLGTTRARAALIHSLRPRRARDGVVLVDANFSGGDARILVPRGARLALVHHAHAERGHFDKVATLQALSRSFYWPSMSNDVAELCAACEPCQRARQVPGRADLGQARLSMAKMACLVVDLQGPIEGHYIVTACDVATRMQFASLTTKKSAAAVANALERALRPHSPWPLTIVCDDGSEFYGDFARLMRKHGIIVDRNAPYNEDARGAVERAHRVNLAVLAKLRAAFPRASIRDLVLEAVWATNTRPYSDTGVSAYEAYAGVSPFSRAERAAIAPPQIIAAVKAAATQHHQQHVAHASAELVRANVERVQQRRESENNYRLRLASKRLPPQRSFKEGDLVWYDGARTGDKFTQRLARVGPFEVANVRDNGHTATLRNGSVVKEPKVATRNLLPYVEPFAMRMLKEEGCLEQQLALRGAAWPKWLTEHACYFMPRQA